MGSKATRKGVGIIFSTVDLTAAVFRCPGGRGAEPRFLFASMVKLKEFRGANETLSPWPAPANGCQSLCLSDTRPSFCFFLLCPPDVPSPFNYKINEHLIRVHIKQRVFKVLPPLQQSQNRISLSLSSSRNRSPTNRLSLCTQRNVTICLHSYSI